MNHYYVNDNAQADSGQHEVHKDSCSYLPIIRSKTYLGIYVYSSEALKKAKTIYVTADGCAYCCPEINHG